MVSFRSPVKTPKVSVPGTGSGRGGINFNPGAADITGGITRGGGGPGAIFSNFNPKGLGDPDYWSSRDPTTAGRRAGDRAKEDVQGSLSKYEKAYGEINPKLDTADQDYLEDSTRIGYDYLRDATGNVNKVQGDIGKLEAQAKGQAKDARQVYSNDILPGYKDAMGKAKMNADQAMTLGEAMDPNNPVMQAVRALYEKQAQAARKTGQQDFGVLAGLGAQAAGQQLGAAGSPMTAGAQGQIYAANQAQAGDAYARAQQRMYDLQQQGLDKSFDQSNRMYEYGQAAQGRYSDTIKDLQGGEDAFYDQQGRFRGELGDYAGARFDINQGLAQDKLGIKSTIQDLQKGTAYAGAGRQGQLADTRLGVETGTTLAGLQGANAQGAANSGLLGSVFGGLMTYAASDERGKKGISAVSDAELDEFLSAVEPKTFQYKDTGEPGTAPGERIGFMLQDVQGTELGDAMTRKGPNGKLMYDRDNLNGIILAALSRQAKKRAA